MFLRRQVALALGALALAACGARPITVSGRVVDDRGTAVQKAEITTEPETDVVVTNPRGYFVLRQRITETGQTQPIPPGVYTVVVKKFGYEDLTLEVKLEGGESKVPDLSLVPRTPDIGETAPDPTAEQELEPDEGSTPVGGI